MEFPTKKYNIIYADPPWTYNDKCKSGDRGLENKYDTMIISQLMELPVESIAADDCFLFMWVTYPLLQEGFQVMKAWGFEYKTVAFTWIKKNKVSDSFFLLISFLNFRKFIPSILRIFLPPFIL